MSQSPETINLGPDNKIESYGSAAEQLEKISKENSSEFFSDKNESKIESARSKVFEAVIGVESKSKIAETAKDNTPFKKIEVINKKHLDESYKKTIKQVQKELSPAERTFSKIIHNKVVDNASNAISSTIARPNAILFGSFSAFVITISVYLMAKSLGYQLSGFESILAFVIGWIIGILFDYLRIIITGKK